MDLHLQFGHGMMAHARTLLAAQGGGTVILSPRDLEPAQLERFSRDVTRGGGRVLLDPQFYLPHADHKRLCSHPYWPAGYQTALFWNGPALGELLTALGALNTTLGAQIVLLPGMLADQVDDDWLACQRAVVDAAAAAMPDTGRMMTVALSADAARNPDQVHELLEASADWTVQGIYLVCEHPKGLYLVEDPLWLATTLDLIAGWRLRGHEVIVGYSCHQMLLAAAAKATAIASGTWLNVRAFPPQKFRMAVEEERRKSTWYYCPQALSEFKLEYLDLAQSRGLLPRMAPDPTLGSTYADALFAGPQPTSIGWTEQAAFRHYLQALHGQATGAVRATFDETADAHERMLDDAATLLDDLHRQGVRGLKRDFGAVIDVNRAALQALRSTRGIMLRRKWAQL